MSIVAMAIPIGAMVVLLSVFNGLENMVCNLYESIDADIVISPTKGTTFDQAHLQNLKPEAVEGVEAWSYTLEQGAMAEHNGNRAIVRVKGVDEAYTKTLPIERQITSGAFQMSLDEKPAVVASRTTLIALRLTNVSPNEKLSLYAINRQRISTVLPTGGFTRRDMSVAGIYNIDDQNADMVFCQLEEAQRLLNYPGRCSALEIKVRPGADIDYVKEQLQQRVGKEYKVLTRNEHNSIYRLMTLEKWGVYAISLLIMAIASLTIVGTLIMVIIDKREERNTLLTMGATPSLIRGIFVAEGRIMAWRSLMIGMVMGVALTVLQQQMGIVQIDATTLMVDAYPIELRGWDVVAVAVGYIVIAECIVWLTVRAMIKQR